jgi:hypothetical protein
MTHPLQLGHRPASARERSDGDDHDDRIAGQPEHEVVEEAE